MGPITPTSRLLIILAGLAVLSPFAAGQHAAESPGVVARLGSSPIPARMIAQAFFSPDSRYLLLRDLSAISVLDATRGAEVSQISVFPVSPTSFAFVNDFLLAIRNQDDVVQIVDIRNGTVERELPEVRDGHNFAVSPDRRYLVSTGTTLTIYDLRENTVVHQRKLDAFAYWLCVLAAPTGGPVAVLRTGDTAISVALRDGSNVPPPIKNLERATSAPRFNRDRTVAILPEREGYTLLDMRAGTAALVTAQSKRLPKGMRFADFTPDGKGMIFCESGRIWVYDFNGTPSPIPSSYPTMPLSRQPSPPMASFWPHGGSTAPCRSLWNGHPVSDASQSRSGTGAT